MVLETQKSHPCRSAFGIQMQKYPPVKIKQNYVIQKNIMLSEYMKEEYIFIYKLVGPNWCNDMVQTSQSVDFFSHHLSKEILVEVLEKYLM